MKTIVTYPDPVLRQRAEEINEIDDTVRELVDDMADVMYGDDGIGLAANQVGEARRVFVYDAGEGFHCVINPVLTVTDDEKAAAEEGCLSLPGIQVKVERPKQVRVDGIDLDGNPVSFEAEGLKARVMQHEIDHLNGIMIIDHASSLQRSLLKSKLKKLERGS